MSAARLVIYLGLEEVPCLCLDLRVPKVSRTLDSFECDPEYDSESDILRAVQMIRNRALFWKQHLELEIKTDPGLVSDLSNGFDEKLSVKISNLLKEVL